MLPVHLPPPLPRSPLPPAPLVLGPCPLGKVSDRHAKPGRVSRARVHHAHPFGIAAERAVLDLRIRDGDYRHVRPLSQQALSVPDGLFEIGKDHHGRLSGKAVFLGEVASLPSDRGERALSLRSRSHARRFGTCLLAVYLK